LQQNLDKKQKGNFNADEVKKMLEAFKK
jgi:hypothetical protein